MLSRYPQIELTKFSVTVPYLEAGTEISCGYPIETIDRIPIFAVTDRIGKIPAQSCSVRIIRTVKDIPTSLGNEIAKHAINRGEIRVVIQVLKFDVENDRVSGLVKPKC